MAGRGTPTVGGWRSGSDLSTERMTERYRDEAHLLTKERDEAVALLEKLVRVLETNSDADYFAVRDEVYAFLNMSLPSRNDIDEE